VCPLNGVSRSPFTFCTPLTFVVTMWLKRATLFPKIWGGGGGRGRGRGERGEPWRGHYKMGMGIPNGLLCSLSLRRRLNIVQFFWWTVGIFVFMETIGRTGGLGRSSLYSFLIPPFSFRKGSGGEGEVLFKNQNSVGRVAPLFWRWRWCHGTYKLSPALLGFSYIRISNIHTCHRCSGNLWDFIYTQTIKTWVTESYHQLIHLLHNFYLFILSFYQWGGGGRGGFKGVKRLKRATTLKCSSGHIRLRKN